MKKYIFCFLLILGTSIQQSAQVKIGLMGGMNFSDAKHKQLYFYNPRCDTKFAFGGIVDIQVSNSLSIKFEPQYVEKGTNSNPISFMFISPSVFLDLSYIELPILFTYSVGNELRPYIFAGPTIGVNIGSSVGIESGFIDFSMEADEFIKDYEISFNVGGGINYQVDELLTIFFEAKYAFGLTNILDTGDIDFNFGDFNSRGTIPGESCYKNSGFQITAGFSFPLTIN